MAIEKSFSFAAQKRPIRTPTDAKTARRVRLQELQLRYMIFIDRGNCIKSRNVVKVGGYALRQCVDVANLFFNLDHDCCRSINGCSK